MRNIFDLRAGGGTVITLAISLSMRLEQRKISKQKFNFIQYLAFSNHARELKIESLPKLRDYQEECITSTLQAFRRGVNRQVVSLPVGSGKTVVFSNLIERVPVPKSKPSATKTLVLAHREELIDQAFRQITRWCSNLMVDMEQGRRRANVIDSDVIVASVQTLSRPGSKRIAKFNPEDFKCIIIDEAHHSAASSYVQILEHFDFKNPESHILVWGCSATVQRHDALKLGSIFSEVTHHRSLNSMIKEGWLCPVKVTSVQTRVDIDNVSIKQGDFETRQLSNAVNTPNRNRLIVDTWKEYHDKYGLGSTLVFAVDIAHVHDLGACFRKVIPENSVGILTSLTKPRDRHTMIERFKNGELTVLINCGILTEGTDIPRTNCLVMARPTKSATLLQQMIGRGMRLHSSLKTHCFVLDFVDNCSRSVGVSPSLFGLDNEVDVGKEWEINGMNKPLQKTEKKKNEFDFVVSSIIKRENWYLFGKEGTDNLPVSNISNQQHRQINLESWDSEIPPSTKPIKSLSHLCWIELKGEKQFCPKLQIEKEFPRYALNLPGSKQIVIDWNPKLKVYEPWITRRISNQWGGGGRYYIKTKRIPFDASANLKRTLQAMETYATRLGCSRSFIMRSSKWRTHPCTSKQLNYFINYLGGWKILSPYQRAKTSKKKLNENHGFSSLETGPIINNLPKRPSDEEMKLDAKSKASKLTIGELESLITWVQLSGKPLPGKN